MSRGLEEFLRWCDAQGIEIDARLELRVSSGDGSPVGVFTRPGASIDVGESLASIPKSAVFSTQSCPWSRDMPAGEDPSLDLALALLTELLRGTASRWYAYLNSLPAGIVDIAVFWGVNGARDGVEAREWIRGTELDRLLQSGRLLERVDAYYERTVKPMLRHLGMQSTLNDFYRAYSLVSSRAFLVDAYHGLALVPVADAFNHIEDNHVHLESDYHVCGACGSLTECEHDGGSPGASQEVPADTCEMVARSPVGPGVEVFNSYEAGLTNAELLCQYGFALNDNEHNLVRWTLHEVVGDDGGRAAAVVGLWTMLFRAWPRHSGWDGSELVFNTERDGDDLDDDGVPKQADPGAQLLVLNADGQISHALWLMLVTLALPDIKLAPEALNYTHQVALAQERQELRLGVKSGGALGRTAAAAVRLCEAKLRSVHHAELLQTSMVDLLDSLPEERVLTRRAMGFALEERLVLETCRRAWLDFGETCV